MDSVGSSRGEYPRISVDTMQDWKRVKANFAEAVQTKLFDEYLATSGLTAQKEMIAPHIQQFIDATFEKANLNIRVNGQNFEDINSRDDPEVEPWDEELDRETWTVLYNKRLQWNRELGAKRRTKPTEMAGLLEQMLEAQRVAELEEAEEVGAEAEVMEEPDLDEEALAGAEDTYAKLATLAEGLQQTLQTQQERTTRLKVVEKEVKALKD
ncbi:hypothetical protein FA95DRAFT_1498435 [Auriscalpium vulgare]|uniref:Uncharacterized protein n=1 Tax=Auriscalpium vulgare TaxID=40419 RepID=A0ACB8RJ52_9AGAM|nr:hypothetical protein FA95DRAFT_1498435 [Auriscalpium vulgare]